MSTPPVAPVRRHLLRPLAAVAVAGLLGACGLVGTAADGGAVSTAVPAGPVTLSILTSDDSPATKALARTFSEIHPNVTIDYRHTPYDNYDTNLGHALGSENAPDLALLNVLGDTAASGLIRDLDPYAKAFGWAERPSSAQLDQWRSDGRSGRLGSGSLWAAPAGFSLVGVYYNKDLAAKLGVTAPPQTLGEFEAALAKAKAAGELPLQVSNSDGHASFVFQALADRYQPIAKSTDWAFNAPGSTIVNDATAKAAQKLADWARHGYLPAGANSTDQAGAMAAFTKGRGLFMIDGNWAATSVEEAMPGKAGFFTLPGELPGQGATGVGTSLAYAVPAKARNPEVAAAFLNFLASPEAAAVELANGYLPVAHADTVRAPAGSVLADLVAAWDKVSDDNGLVPYFNNASATMNATLTSQSQQLITGKTSPAAFLEALQADWHKGRQ
ncbi:ABC transporter substrate-binding protein [Kitasatospora sp. NPDC051853]|uniref:ABC transporter substrate-binding protein n=1 Tax=Kitasatospora sp. NPDC051853 TaxID=3364058 RepID=UPI0037B32B16